MADVEIDLLEEVLDLAARVWAHYVASGDWSRAGDWAELAWRVSLRLKPMDPGH